MNSTLKQYYQAEWESDPSLTLQALADRYAFNIEDLGDTSDWKKSKEVVKVSVEPNIMPSKQVATGNQLVDQIAEFKTRAIRECVNRLQYADSIDTKELKELVTTVDVIDKSLKATSEGQNINVLIQNIVNKYGDDC